MSKPVEFARSYLQTIVLNSIIASPLVPRNIRWRLLSAAGADVERCAIEFGCVFGGVDISIGRGTFLNRGVLLDCAARISIGSSCQIGPRVVIATGSHEIGDEARRGGLDRPSAVRIGDGCWIGAGAVVLPGVTVANGCIIAAGSVVTHDLQPNGLYAGVPAVRKRDLPSARARA